MAIPSIEETNTEMLVICRPVWVFNYVAGKIYSQVKSVFNIGQMCTQYSI